MTAIRSLTAASVPSGFGLSVMDAAYGAVGDGVTDDTAAIQTAITDAASRYSLTGTRTAVIFPSGHVFLSSQLIILPGVMLWAYGATIQATTSGWTSHGFLTWRPSGNPPPAGSILTDFSILGGTWKGSGLENESSNMYWLEVTTSAGVGVQDFIIHDTTVTGWGWVPMKILNPTRLTITDNHFYGNEVLKNTGFQNTLNIFIDNTAAFGGEMLTSRNKIHNSTAEAIGVVVGLGASGPTNGRLGWIASENICTADAPRIDQNGVGGATVTVTNGSATVTDTACVAGDLYKYVTGPGIPNVTYISAVTPGTSFTMSKNATAGGTLVSVGVYKSSITLEIDGTSVPITDYTIVNNDCLGYERGVIAVSLPSGGKFSHRGIIANNRITNAQTGTPTKPQGNGIKLGGQNATYDVEVVNNRITAYNEIDVSDSGVVNKGLQSGNKFTTDYAQGQVTLSGGSATVTTTEIRTGDNVILSRVAAGGTTGNLSVGTITAGTSFTITSSSGSDTSIVYWKVDH